MSASANTSVLFTASISGQIQLDSSRSRDGTGKRAPGLRIPNRDLLAHPAAGPRNDIGRQRDRPVADDQNTGLAGLDDLIHAGHFGIEERAARERDVQLPPDEEARIDRGPPDRWHARKRDVTGRQHGARGQIMRGYRGMDVLRDAVPRENRACELPIDEDGYGDDQVGGIYLGSPRRRDCQRSAGNGLVGNREGGCNLTIRSRYRFVSDAVGQGGDARALDDLVRGRVRRQTGRRKRRRRSQEQDRGDEGREPERATRHCVTPWSGSPSAASDRRS